MVLSETETGEVDTSRRNIWIVVGVFGLLLVAAIGYIISRPAAPNVAPRLQNALRAGDAEFEQFKNRIEIDQLEALESPTATGTVWMKLTGTVRNFTGRTINGLEVRGKIVDSQKQVVKERTIIVIPNAQPELASNRTTIADVPIDNISKTAERANIEMEVVAIRFK